MVVVQSIRTIFLYMFLFLLCTQDLWAFKLNLLESTLELGKGAEATTATIVNDSTSMIAIEAVSRVRVYDQNGVENFDAIAEDLIIIPSQMIIPPGSEQVLSIRWTGPRDIEKEQAYRLLIEYVSVSEDKLKGISAQEQQAGININYRIAKSFYVTPKNAKADVVLQEAKKIKEEDAEKLQFSFENIGSKHKIVHAFDVQFTTQANENISLSFPKEKLGGSINFLAKEKRNIVVPLPPELKEHEILSAKIMGFQE